MKRWNYNTILVSQPAWQMFSKLRLTCWVCCWNSGDSWLIPFWHLEMSLCVLSWKKLLQQKSAKCCIDAARSCWTVCSLASSEGTSAALEDEISFVLAVASVWIGNYTYVHIRCYVCIYVSVLCINGHSWLEESVCLCMVSLRHVKLTLSVRPGRLSITAMTVKRNQCFAHNQDFAESLDKVPLFVA